MVTSVRPMAVSSLTSSRSSASCPGVLGHDVEFSSDFVLMTT